MLLMSLVFTFIVVPYLVKSYQPCKRFQTVEVLQRYVWKRTVIPWKADEAVTLNWNKVATVEEYSLDMYRFKEVNNFFIFYYKNNLVGVGPTFKGETETQVVMASEEYKDGIRTKGLAKAMKEFVEAKVSNFVDDFKNIGEKSIFNQDVVIDNLKYNYALILFVDPQILQRNAADPCNEAFIYFEGISRGVWHYIPLKENDILKYENEMKKQGCLDRYGNYYFYSLSDSTKCDSIHGFFGFYDDNGEMSGFGVVYQDDAIVMEQDVNHPNPVSKYIDIADVRKMVPHNMNCLSQGGLTTGLTAIHVFIRPKSQTHDFQCKVK